MKMGKNKMNKTAAPGVQPAGAADPSEPRFMFYYGGNLAKMSMAKKALILIIGEFEFNCVKFHGFK